MEKDTLAKPETTHLESEASVFVVGIGASAGGLEALETFFAHIPPTLREGVCFVVIQHLAKGHKSVMDRLIGRHTELEVTIPETDVQLTPGKVYLNPPGKRFVVEGQWLRLSAIPEGVGEHFPIDAFFRALAKAFDDRCAGIVLSGTGSDGSQGVRAIKAQGGLVMVQEPNSAAFDGMPQRAIETGLADFILPPAELPPALAVYLVSDRETPEELPHLNDDTYFEVLQILKQDTHTDFHRYKPETVRRRILRRMHLLQMASPGHYLGYLQQHREEALALRQDLFIGLTRFFRDPDFFAHLQEAVLPRILQEGPEEDARFWVPACATGEEAYTLGILLMELQDQHPDLRNKQVKIFATDANEDSIRYASRGIYPESIASDISRERLARFFLHTGHGYQVQKALREMIVFTPHNLVQDAPFHRLDLISCRNLLIYFQPALQQKLFAVFNFALRQNGYLLLGPSESAESYPEIFKRLSPEFQVYQSVYQSRPRPNKETRDRINGPASTLTATISRQAFRNRILEISNEIMVGELGAACLVVNEDFELLRYFGDAPRYLEVPREPSNWNLLRMVGPELSATISAGLRRALTLNEQVVYAHIHPTLRDGSNPVLDLKIIPHRVASHDQTLFYLLIQEAAHQTAPAPVSGEVRLHQDAAQRIADLEQELHVTRENLQATIEELQTSNEELLSANEELQGTNEELQSVNEELYTINAEHQDTISTLTRLNNDMDNLLQNSKIGIIFLDANLCIRRFNQSATQEVFIAPQDIGRPLAHFSTRLAYQNLVDDARQVLETDKPFQREVHSHNGKWYVLRIMPYHEQDQAVTGVVISLVDISEVKDTDHLRRLLENMEKSEAKLVRAKSDLREAERHLRLQQKVLQSMVDQHGNLFILADRNGRSLSFQAGQQFPRLPFLPDFPGRGTNIREFLPEAFLTPLFRKAREVSAEEITPPYLFDWGEAPAVAHFAAHFFWLGDGETGILVCDRATEISHERQLRFHETLCRLIARNIPDSFIAIYNRELQFTFCDGVLSPGPEVGKHVGACFPENLAGQVTNACESALANRPVTQEIAQGKDFFIYQTIPVLDENGHIEGGLLIIQLINDMKRVQRALEAKVADLEQFAFSVSHDLKSPLRSISGFSQLLLKRYREQLDTNAREYLDLIVSNTASMTDLINGVLEYARLGQAELNFDPVSLTEVMDKVISNLAGHLRPQQDHIVVGPGLPVVYGHRAQLTQLLQNLVENGLKFNESPAKEVNITATEEADHWLLCVQDNGIGIAPTYHEQIFSIFKFLNDRRQYSGNGIGLAVCRRIVERMEGRIWVESATGAGARFFIQLPKRKVLPPAEMPEA